MIPVRLTVRNFLCYGDDVPPLDFDGIGVACLSGDNGAGKSALLDAMTWALWGKARTRSDDDLVHTGRQNMEVEFEFRVGDEQYRVVRKRRRGANRAGHTVLELNIWDGSQYREITEVTVRDTEHKIIEILRMDYETFIHSAFLQQGKADQFTVSAPDKRKQVLGSILELDRYDKMAESAREKAKQLEADSKALEVTIAGLDRELAGREDAEAEAQEIEETLLRKKQEVQTYSELVDSLRRDQQALQRYRQQADEIAARLRDVERELGQRSTKIAEHEKAIAQLENTIANQEQIENGYNEFRAAQEEAQWFSGLLVKLRDLERQQNELEKSIEAARMRLEAEGDKRAEELKTLSEEAARLPELEGQLARAQGELDAIASLEAQGKELREHEQKAKLDAQALATENGQLTRDEAELERKLQELSGSEANCPLCGNDLGEGGAERLQTHFREEFSALQVKVAANEGQRQAAIKDAAAHAKEAEALEARAKRERYKVERRRADLEVQIEKARAAKRRVPDIAQALAEVQAALSSEAYAGSHKTQLAGVLAEIHDIGYDAEAHKRASSQVETLKGYEQRQRELERALQQLEPLQQLLAAAKAERQRGLLQREEALRQGKEVETALSAYPPDLEQKLASAQDQLRQTQIENDRLQEALGAARQRVDMLRQKAYEREEKAKRLAELNTEKSTYDELVVAFGRSGVQALLIESALPELTEEANQILARMTNNRMNVDVRTQRNKRSGDGLIETLDIIISDEFGPRNYELYSGGEAFRVNFALRVALSKLLAHRKGAPLPTLIIDEGFGTQDSAGRERLIEAIQSVQNDFQCILVITHISELRDAFPIRIECAKTTNGSVASVVRE